MDYRYVYKSLISKCDSEEEKEKIRQEYLSLAKLSGTTRKEAVEFMKKVEAEMDDRGEVRDS
jgi:hypothetical protein